MKKLFVLTFTLFLCFGSYGQTEDTTIHFKELIGWMKYGFAGQNLDAYKAFAQGKGLEQLYEEDKTTEVIFAWGKGIEYGRKGYSEVFTAKEEVYQAFSIKVTPNKNLYTPMGMTVLFPSQEAQQVFWQEGIEYGCVENKEIEETDLEYNWKDVKGLKYNENSKVLTSWRFIYFYHIGDLYFASFQ